MKPDYGPDDLMVIAAFRYCCGRQTYIVSECVDWLIKNWSTFSERARIVIKRDLETEFEADDRARASGSDYKPLGWDCDRQEWEKLRSHINMGTMRSDREERRRKQQETYKQSPCYSVKAKGWPACIFCPHEKEIFK